MCKLINWTFLLCDPDSCDIPHKIQVQPCEMFAHLNSYPWDDGYRHADDPTCWTKVENREAEVLCSKCFTILVESYDKNDADFYNESECCHKNSMTIIHADNISETIDYWEPGLPQKDVGFNQTIEWNPPPRILSPSDIPLSPKAPATIAQITADLLNLQTLDHVREVVEADRLRRSEEANLSTRSSSEDVKDISNLSDDESNIIESKYKWIIDTAIYQQNSPTTSELTISARRRCTDSLYSHTLGQVGTRPTRKRRRVTNVRVPAPSSNTTKSVTKITLKLTQNSPNTKPPSSPSSDDNKPKTQDPFQSWKSQDSEPGWAPKLTAKELARRWL